MKFTEEEKKIRVIERAIRKRWDAHEKLKNDFLDDINEFIRMRDIEKRDFNELLAEIKTADDLSLGMEKEIAYRARRLHLAEMRVFRAKNRFAELYWQEILLK